MSTGLHAAARGELGLPHVNASAANNMPPSSQGYLSIGAQNDGGHGGLPKPLSLSPRTTFGMDDLRDFCGPLGSFKTGLTPRFSTGLTPRSGFTPRFTTGFTPRPLPTGPGANGNGNGSSASNGNGNGSNGNGSNPNDTNGFFSRNTGFSPRSGESNNKISPTGFTPKDVTGLKMPMRFPGTFTSSPPKLGMHDPMQSKMGMHDPMQHMHNKGPHGGHHPQQHPQHPGGHPHPSHHHMGGGPAPHEMTQMNMAMFDYMNRQGVPTPPQSANTVRPNVSPMSEKTANSTQDELDERRRMKNRERVRKCRKRKQDRLNFLEERTADLEKENGNLKAKLARSSASGRAEPLTEAQMKELRKKQNTTLSAYIRAFNEIEGAFEAGARSVWADNAEIMYGNQGQRLVGIDNIIFNKKEAAAVFSSFKIKQYNVQWKPEAHEKCIVYWEVEATLQPNATAQRVPCTAPFSELSAFVGEADVLSFTLVSHLTFDDGKIAEEARQVQLMQVAETILAKYASEPKKASDVLRCLLNV
ncbi:TPA: hypothetical protein N0F65_010975 [Lagenidium giganteum]|uniref:BZIP domain-containing protein n=1 Tax=Lagenidium giganteum TaxID=4803 RepID=A0AAV2Z554_9STRA|nr:TPA: hypothetical protein N0F65_010975 [Lagenidium giganteum]